MAVETGAGSGPAVTDARCATVSDRMEPEGLQRLSQAGLVEVFGYDT